MTPDDLKNLKPYPGLRPFTEDESRIYFGRESQIGDLAARLEQHRFVAVTGASGSGKTSLIRAGLLPGLKGGLPAPAGSHWRIAIFRPGNSPIKNLAEALVHQARIYGYTDPADESKYSFVETVLRRSGLGLVEAVRVAELPHQHNLLVVVDQFEELFRYRAAAQNEAVHNETAAFVKLLIEAVRQHKFPIYVVITMRSDYIGECAQFYHLPELINEGQYLVPRLNWDQRRAAIESPAALKGMALEKRLVNQLLNDAGDSSDQLPLLQHVLMRTYDHWEGHHDAADDRITMGDYEATGGMASALSRHADEAFGELDGAQQLLAEKLFKAITTKEKDRKIRRPTRLGEICEIAGAAPEALMPVIEVFRREGRSFLTPAPAIPLTPDSVIDISHESLIRHWDRLDAWVDAEADAAAAYIRLADAAARHARGEAGLLRSPELEIALRWKTENQPTRNWAERYHPEYDAAMQFLQKSRERRRREQIQKRFSRYGLAVILTALALLVVFMIEQRKLDRQLQAKSIALESAQYLTTNPNLSISLAIKAISKTREPDGIILPEAENALHRAIQASKIKYRSFLDTVALTKKQCLSFSPASPHIAVGDRNGCLTFWDYQARTVIQMISAHQERINGIAYFPAGDRVATAGKDGRIYIWDALNGRKLDSLDQDIDPGQTADIKAVVISSDGGVIAAGNKTGVVNTWDGSTGAPLATFPVLDFAQDTVKLWNIALDASGTRLAAACDDGMIRVYDLANRLLIFNMPNPPDTSKVYAVAFNPANNNRLYTSGSNSAREGVLAWDIPSGSLRFSCRGHTNTVFGLAVKFDGTQLATAGSDNSVRVWDAQNGDELYTLLGHDDWVNGAAFSPDGREFASVSSDSSLILWNLSPVPVEDFNLAGHTNRAVMVRLNPVNEHIAASAGWDSTARIWDLESGRELFRLNFHRDIVPDLSFSPDGRYLATGSLDKRFAIWEVASGNMIDSMQLNREIRSVDFRPRVKAEEDRANTPNAYQLAIAGDSVITLWNMRSPDPLSAGQPGTTAEKSPLLDSLKIPPLIGHTGNVNRVRFSPDGSLLASAGSDTSVKLWDSASGENIRTLKEREKKIVWSLAFDPAGKYLISGGADNKAIVWEVRTGIKTTDQFTHFGSIYGVAFSSDGKRIVTGSFDNYVKVWDWDKKPHPDERLPALTFYGGPGNGNKFYDVNFSPSGKRLAAACADGSIRLFIMDIDELLQLARERVKPASSISAQ